MIRALKGRLGETARPKGRGSAGGSSFRTCVVAEPALQGTDNTGLTVR